MLRIANDRHGHSLWSAARLMLIGGVIGLLVFGLLFAAFWTVADTQWAVSVTDEDGAFEWLGAGAFLVGAILQFVLFWRSDVPETQRLIPFMRRNVFYLGLAAVLFLAFAEEISWGQRIIGWETPENLIIENRQGETNIHNLAPFQGLLNVTRLFNAFWLGYCVLVPLTAVAVPFLGRLYQRVALPIPPYWVGGLFLGHFLAWRIYVPLQPPDGIAEGDEVQEAFLAICWVVLGVAQIRDIHLGGDAEHEASRATAPRT